MAPQNEGLTPTADEVERANRVLDFFAQLDAAGEAEGDMDGETVDAYEAARARELIEWATLCAARDAEKSVARERTEAEEASE